MRVTTRPTWAIALALLAAICVLLPARSAEAIGWSSGQPLEFPPTRVGTTSPVNQVDVTVDRNCTQNPTLSCDWEPLYVAITGPFQITSQDCTVPPFRRPRCVIYVAFTPTQRGLQQGHLSVAGGVALAGTGCTTKKGKLLCSAPKKKKRKKRNG